VAALTVVFLKEAAILYSVMFYGLAYLGNILDEGDKELEVGEEVEQGEHAVFHHQQQDHCKSGNNRGRLSNTSSLA
jgi:hypothetical protein